MGGGPEGVPGESKEVHKLDPEERIHSILSGLFPFLHLIKLFKNRSLIINISLLEFFLTIRSDHILPYSHTRQVYSPFYRNGVTSIFSIFPGYIY